jgi:hypothetical protein
MDWKKYLIGGLFLVAISSSLTYYLAPKRVKIKTVEKIVIKEKKVKVVDRDIETHREVKPDGTVIEVIKDRSKERSTEDRDTVENRETEKTIKRGRKDWLVGGGVIVSDRLSLGRPVYYGQVQRRILGEIYVGAMATSDRAVGIGITIRF